MIQELKLQDPTKPMDSAKMLSTQMQMSTISTNQEMIKAMQSIQTAFLKQHYQMQLELLEKYWRWKYWRKWVLQKHIL